MFGNNKLEMQKELTKRELKLALINSCNDKTLKKVVTDSDQVAMIQLAGIKSVRQEEKGWYYSDTERDTMLIKYLDDSWERMDMTVENFARQTGYAS